MVFSSIPVYLDPPNWHHHHQSTNQLVQHDHQGEGGASASYEAPPHGQQQLPPLPNPQMPHGGVSIRPGSMADRARMAKIPQPEPGLKCPRCESTNTKFCYFNNYNLTQPRHFCKTCRRYWTKGGALRNVPVGGGCRRNKKSGAKGNKNPGGSGGGGGGGSSGSGTSTSSAAGAGGGGGGGMILPSEIMGHLPHHHQLPPFLAHQFGAGNIGSSGGGSSHLGLNYGGGGSGGEMGLFQMGGGGNNSGMVQQFPFFEAAAAGNNLYGTFQNEGMMSGTSNSSSRVNNSQLASVKPELQGVNLSRPPFADSDSSNQYWGGGRGGGGNASASWTDLTGLNSHN